MLGVTYHALFECLAPLFQVFSLLALVVAIALGVRGWQAYLASVGIMMFGTAIPTTMAVLLHDASFRDYRMKDLLRMIALGPLDLLLYRPCFHLRMILRLLGIPAGREGLVQT